MASIYEEFAASAVEELASSEGWAGAGEEGFETGDLDLPATDTFAQHGAAKQAVREPAPKLIVVANRLPLTVKRDAATNEYSFKVSSGGLVSALMGVRSKINFLWLGWLGQDVPEEDQPRVAAQLLREHQCIPVFLPPSIADDFYNGACNGILWPNFHVELATDSTVDPTGKLWQAYREANVCFAKAVLSVARKQDLIWNHDYHLTLVNFLLRRALGEEATIAWFLHTPFPSSEIFRALPMRGEILRGLLAGDLLGFHTADYGRHFLSSAQRLLPDIVSSSPSSITRLNTAGPSGGAEATATHPAAAATTRTRLVVDPIGIEPEVFQTTVETPQCQARIKELAERYGAGGRKIIVSVDRLDLIKGLVQRLLGLETFFRLHPQFVGKVHFIQVAVPSRQDVPAYQKLTREVNQLVARINLTYGDISSGYQPVHYFYRSVDPTELCALYAIGDACLITSLRDGLNLVSEESIACQAHLTPNRTAPGVIVLSEFAGVAQSLGSGALRVNPWDPRDIAKSLNEALTMADEEKYRRWRLCNDYISVFTSQHWAESFVSEMKDIQREKRDRRRQALGEQAVQKTQVPPNTSSATLAAKVAAGSVVTGQPKQLQPQQAAASESSHARTALDSTSEAKPSAVATAATKVNITASGVEPSSSAKHEHEQANAHEHALSLAQAMDELKLSDAPDASANIGAGAGEPGAATASSGAPASKAAESSKA